MTQTILIVEDCDADRYFLSRALRKAAPGSTIVEFDYADEALSYLRSANRPELDLIFVDINMPRMDGFAFVEAYETLYPELKGAAQVWVMSHSIDPRDRDRAEEHSAVAGFVTKTFVAADIRDIVARNAPAEAGTCRTG